jgi:very-short-patch-repair endonuclease
VLDFYCVAVRLAIEVDGFAHDNSRAVTKDRRRSEWLRSQGVATTRISARLVLDDPDAVVIRIVEICRERTVRLDRIPNVPLHQPAVGPPPRNGEE